MLDLSRRKTNTEVLKELKEAVESSREYFSDNIKRYHEIMKFTFMTSLSPDDETKLNILQKPVIEFNMLEAMISRLRGEFAKHEPQVNARAADGVRVEDITREFLKQQEVIEGHFREIFFDAANDSLEYNIYTDLLGGGYSVAHVYTDYINEMSFEQNIKVERVFDPTLTGFDPLARESHKGDGNYCFMLYPKTLKDFENEFGKEAAEGISYTRSSEIDGFSWSYKNQKDQIIMVADFYIKVKKKEKIAKLSNGHTILKKHYENLLEIFRKEEILEQSPIIVSERMSMIETIERYQFCENKILSHDKTNFKHLPLVFFDGNSMNIRASEGGATEQMTRPYVYQAIGAQKLMNFAGQSVGAEIENMVQHKFIISAEAIAEGYEEAYKNPQLASVLLYNAFYKDNPEFPLNPPIPVQRTQTPPIVENTFVGMGKIVQTILGNHDSILGVNDKEISGKAIQQGAIQCDASGMPYIVGYIKGINRIAQILMDLIPKYYVTPRSLPIMLPDGKRSFQIINHPTDPESIDMKYNPNNMQIKIEAGVSSTVQKQVALEQIVSMMQASETFAHFINSMGLETILDNMDIRGIESLKAQAVEFMKKTAEAEAAAVEKGDPQTELTMAQMETLKQVEEMKVQQQMIKAEGDHAVAAAKVAVEKQNSDLKFLEVMAKIEEMGKQSEIEEAKLDSENARSAVEMALNVHKHHAELANQPTGETNETS